MPGRKCADMDTRAPPSPALGNWYATAILWKPQLALVVNERTLLPVLMPMAPASTLIARFPRELATALISQGPSQVFTASEVAAMSEVSVAEAADRSVVGTMNEFSFLAEGYRESLETSDLLALSMRLADATCSAIERSSPARLIEELLGATE